MISPLASRWLRLCLWDRMGHLSMTSLDLKREPQKGTSKGKAALTGLLKTIGNDLTSQAISTSEYVSNVADRDYRISKKIQPAVGVVRDAVNTTRTKIRPK